MFCYFTHTLNEIKIKVIIANIYCLNQALVTVHFNFIDTFYINNNSINQKLKFP